MTLISLFLSMLMIPLDSTEQSPLQKFLPASVHQWSFSEASREYSGDKIFDYMDGAGEVYLAYQYQHLLVQHYSRPGQEEILVELFDMGSSQNAFGIYSYMQGRGPRVSIGQDGEYKSGLLCFWKGRYFVSIMVDHENQTTKKAILKIGESIAGAIAEQGPRPAILEYVPHNMMVPASLRFFHRHEILRVHFFVANNNILRLNDQTEGVLVRTKKDRSYLLLIGYPEIKDAESAQMSFTAHYMPEASEKGIIKTENKKWTACLRKEKFLVLVFDAVTKSNAQNLLTLISRRLP